jgi:hypothetical protein
MYEKAIVAMAKQSVTLEVLSYHASASSDDATRLMVSAFTFMMTRFNIGFPTASENPFGSLLPTA